MASSRIIIKSAGLFLCIVLFCSMTAWSVTYYVDDDAPNDPGPYDPNVSDPLMDGSIDHPFDNIQEGINAAVNGDTVIVLQGTYKHSGNISFDGKNIVLTSVDPNNPDVISTTIIDGEGCSNIIFSGNETSACQLRGFTIQNCYGGHQKHGGGISGNWAYATIANCTISGNRTDTGYMGGGIAMILGSIENCTIINNSAGSGGGLQNCGGIISNCTIAHNSASWYGGGLYQCNGLITDCIITSNSSGGRAGGIAWCNGTIQNCVIAGNFADTDGGGLNNCNGILKNCTITGNSAADEGGGLYLCDEGSITNCIIWANTAGNFGDQLKDCSVPTFSCIQDWTGGGAGNINSVPLFTDTSSPDPADWDLHLSGSNCIDSGTNSPPGGLPLTDIEGVGRPFDGNLDGIPMADMGAYELHEFPVNACLYMTSDLLSFSAFKAGENPADQTVTIRNLGNQTLNWFADLTGKPNWLTVTMASGTLEHAESDNIAFSVDITGLSGSQYSYSFEVFDPAALNSPQTVTVDLQIIGPILSVSKTNVTFMAYEDGADPDAQTLTISNPGGANLDWSMDLTGKPDWFSIAPISGSLEHNQSELLTLSVDITGVSGGRYSYTFKVSDPSAQNSPKTVTVNLEVTGPMLEVSSNAFTFTTTRAGTDSNSQTLMISNPGGGMLNWTSDLTDKPEWLTITPTSGSLGHTQSEPVTLLVNTAGLTGSFDSYTFDVTDPIASNSPQSIAVTLNVGGITIYVPNDYPTIQAAINTADDGDAIVVSPGIYVENIHFNGKNIVLTSMDPQNSGVVASTIIDGDDWEGPVVTFSGSETSACQLSGFTITDGQGDGGIRGQGTLATISHCNVTGNSGQCGYSQTFEGAGISDCDGMIKNCLIAYNGADGHVWEWGIENGYGGGLALCDGMIIDCTIVDNGASEDGGGLFRCNGTIANCTIAGNGAYGVGGGLADCQGLIKNCIITDNWGTRDGGGLYRCNGTIVNCTIAGNTGQYGHGGGLCYCDGTIINCILWNNTADVSGSQLYNSSTPTYSCIQDWTGGGTGNINGEPLFADAANDDYHLKSEYGRWNPNATQWVFDDVTSSCIDAGSPYTVSEDPNVTSLSDSWQNELWPHGGRINMGAYGGTPQASMSANPVGNVADLDHDDQVGLLDLDRFCEDWLLGENLLDTDLNRNGIVDIADFTEFSSQWLWRQE